ncbi:MAG TPA: pyridoxine 5'-phosphate synthase [Planctomycetaceae bacterium]|nr:pyridoxine 5'-phosphate synthase [Planctomycetaceae bacterium]
MPRLGVNIDHVATIRQARKTYEPDPALAVSAALLGGAEVITIHLREDRRHIQDRDVRVIRELVHSGLNLEISCDPEIVHIACEVVPDQATLVPERREEVTTEGGLDVAADSDRVASAIDRLQSKGIDVSLFIDPDERQVAKSAALGVGAVELHTGAYADAPPHQRDEQLNRLRAASEQCTASGIRLHAGHGLNYVNVAPVAQIPGMLELNIGHSIIARAVFKGLETAVREMKQAIDAAMLTLD